MWNLHAKRVPGAFGCSQPPNAYENSRKYLNINKMKDLNGRLARSEAWPEKLRRGGRACEGSHFIREVRVGPFSGPKPTFSTEM